MAHPEGTRRTVPAIIIDAFDVDIQIFSSQLLEQLKGSRTFADLVDGAERNPIAFRNLLRALSAIIQTQPTGSNLLYDTISDQLRVLPLELHRLITAGGSIARNLEDPEYRRLYEEAVSGLSDADLAKLAQLPQSRIREWVYSPKPLRPHLLNEWTLNKFPKTTARLQASARKAEEDQKPQHVLHKLYQHWVRAKPPEHWARTIPPAVFYWVSDSLLLLGLFLVVLAIAAAIGE